MSACTKSICAGLLVALAAGGCGGSAKRDSVKAYINRVNAVQHQAAGDMARANRTYVAFEQRKLNGVAAASRLAGAERAIRSTRAQLARLQSPAPARVLRQRLLHLYDLDAQMAAETTALGRYLPAAQRVLGPLAHINITLRTALHASQVPARQAAALGSFADGLGRLVSRLRVLAPPPLLVPTHRSQIARLDRTRALALRLRGAIKARNARGVAAVLVRFRQLNARFAPNGSGLQASAVRAYARRYEALRQAAADVQTESARLERTLR